MKCIHYFVKRREMGKKPEFLSYLVLKQPLVCFNEEGNDSNFTYHNLHI